MRETQYTNAIKSIAMKRNMPLYRFSMSAIAAMAIGRTTCTMQDARHSHWPVVVIKSAFHSGMPWISPTVAPTKPAT